MDSSEKLTTDLFGDVVTLPSGRRGRPSHCWTKSNADRVIIGLAMGYTDAEIASGLGVSLPTLRKYYFSDLKRREMQRTRFELWRAEQLARQAGDGNVGAMKELGKLIETRDRKRALDEYRDDDEDQVADERLGKKELARRAAAEITDGDKGGDWGDLVRPGVYHS